MTTKQNIKTPDTNTTLGLHAMGLQCEHKEKTPSCFAAEVYIHLTQTALYKDFCRNCLLTQQHMSEALDSLTPLPATHTVEAVASCS